MERKCTFSDIGVLSLYLSNGFPTLYRENQGAKLSRSAPCTLPLHTVPFSLSRRRRLVERTGDHVELLLLGELDEVHRVAGDAHGQVRVLFRMLDGILELFLAQHVDVGVVQTVAVAGVQNAHEVADALILVAAQAIR